MGFYYVFVLSVAFVDHPIFGIGIGGFTVEKMIGFAALLYSAFHLSSRKIKPVFMGTWSARAVVAFFLVSSYSYLLFGRQLVKGQVFAFHPFNFLLLLLMTVSVVDTIPRLRSTLLAALGSIAWASLYMLKEWHVGTARYGSSYRPGFVVGDPNYFASSAVLVFPLAYCLAQSMPRWSLRWYCIACIGLILVGITVSASRGGYLGLITTVLMMIWYSKRRVRTIIILATLLGIVLVILPASPLDRLLRPTSSDQTAKDTRIVLWSAAWDMFRDHPLTGVGYGNFRYTAPQYLKQELAANYLVHNQYLEELAENGFPGLLAYCGMYIGSLVTLNRVHSAAKHCRSPFLVNVALGIQIGLIGFAVSVLFLSAEFLRMFWLMVSLSACMPALVADAMRRNERLEREGSGGQAARIPRGRWCRTA